MVGVGVLSPSDRRLPKREVHDVTLYNVVSTICVGASISTNLDLDESVCWSNLDVVKVAKHGGSLEAEVPVSAMTNLVC